MLSILVVFVLCGSILCGCTDRFGSASMPTSVTQIQTEPTAATEEIVMVPEEADGTVRVSDVDAFLAALAPDTEIVLEPGTYNLTEASNYGRGGSEWYHWESTYDGYQLMITDLQGLTIRSENPYETSIVTQPRYSNVMVFENVSNVTLSGITAGHTEEQGSCTGGVLLLDRCSHFEIQNSRLYGCGTRAVDMDSCWDVRVTGSDLFECSEGCVYISGSKQVVFENDKFYRCNLWNGVFEVYTSWDVAFINSEVFENIGIYPEYGCLISSSSPGVYLGGLDVHDNNFMDVFVCTEHPVTVEKCRFDHPARSWASELYPVDADGKTLESGDLAGMSMRIVKLEPMQPVEQPVPEAGEDGKIHVSTVDEFLAAIASDTTIYLEPGTYDLSKSATYGSVGGDFYHWEMDYDGPELVISGVSNLTIEGAGKDQVTIVAIPRYANVLRFERCSGLILRNFTAGHTQAPGECSGGVIQLMNTSNTNIEGCGLYGCGIIGVWAMDCSNLSVVGTEIYECSSGAVWLYSCHNVSVDYCDIHDIGGMEFYFTEFDCTNITVDGKPMEMK